MNAKFIVLQKYATPQNQPQKTTHINKHNISNSNNNNDDDDDDDDEDDDDDDDNNNINTCWI